VFHDDVDVDVDVDARGAIFYFGAGRVMSTAFSSGWIFVSAWVRWTALLNRKQIPFTVTFRIDSSRNYVYNGRL
jgi:hypothetical protein